MKGLLSMGLDKLVASQLKKFQEQDNCPKALKNINAKELIGDAMHFTKFKKEETNERKAYGASFLQKYFTLFEPLIMQNLLMYEQKAGAKYELRMTIDNDAIFFDMLQELIDNPEYGSKIYPQLEGLVKEFDSDIETVIFGMIRTRMEAQGMPLSLKCEIVKSEMDSGEVLSREERRLSEVRSYFQKQ